VNENASYPASGLEILSAPHYTKEINQKAREIWLFGNDFLSVVSWLSYNVDRRIPVTEIRHQSTTATRIFLLMPFFSKRVIHSSVFARGVKRDSAVLSFELVTAHFTCHRSQRARYRSNIAELDFRFRHWYATVHQPRSQGPLSTWRKYPGCGWSRAYVYKSNPHRGGYLT